MTSLSKMQVVEVTAETNASAPPEIPLHLLPGTGQVAMQLRTTVSRIAVGAGLARNELLLQRFRDESGLAVVTSPAGGTVVMTGPGVMGFSAIGVPPPSSAFSLDWMLQRVSEWFTSALASLGVHDVSVGRVDGAWCPGFSDIAVAGKKLVGIGFRVTKDWVVARGVLPVKPYRREELEALARCHALLGMHLEPEKITSVQECTGHEMDVAKVIAKWREISA